MGSHDPEATRKLTTTRFESASRRCASSPTNPFGVSQIDVLATCNLALGASAIRRGLGLPARVPNVRPLRPFSEAREPSPT